MKRFSGAILTVNLALFINIRPLFLETRPGRPTPVFDFVMPKNVPLVWWMPRFH